jgi:hypothetical protein
MEHEMAMRQMRAHLARAGREIQSTRQLLETPTTRGTNLALARALANATASIDDAMDTIQQSLSERGGPKPQSISPGDQDESRNGSWLCSN